MEGEEDNRDAGRLKDLAVKRAKRVLRSSWEMDCLCSGWFHPGLRAGGRKGRK